MNAALNLTIIILAFAGIILITSLPDKLYLKNAKSFRIGEFRLEHPALFWLMPLMAIVQILFGIGSIVFTTYLLGDWFWTIGNFTVFFMAFAFWLGIFFPLGIVEFVFGFSVFPFNKPTKLLSVSTGENVKKCGLLRVFLYFAMMAIIILIYFFQIKGNA